jgi:hypothetical protein
LLDAEQGSLGDWELSIGPEQGSLGPESHSPGWEPRHLAPLLREMPRDFFSLQPNECSLEATYSQLGARRRAIPFGRAGARLLNRMLGRPDEWDCPHPGDRTAESYLQTPGFGTVHRAVDVHTAGATQ